MISNKHKAIFVHIPKVAGQSIETMFLKELGLDWNKRAGLLLRKKKAFEKGPHRLAHLRARDYVDYGYIDEDSFNDYYKFSFVRNPYKRVFSFYNFLGYSKIISINTFIMKVLPSKVEKGDFFLMSQYDYLFNSEGDLMVDYVGKLENINIDVIEVIKSAGLKNSMLPHVNKSKGEWKRALSQLIKSPYLLRYIGFKKDSNNNFEKVFTQDLKNQVYNIYQKDFHYFNYER